MLRRYALSIMPIALPARPAEAHALDIARALLAADGPAAAAQRVVCTTSGRGQAAFELAAAHPAAGVTVWFLDLFPQAAAVAAWESPPPGLHAVCTADMPPGPYDLAVVPLSKNGEAELSRDILQSAFLQLAIGGRLVAAIGMLYVLGAMTKSAQFPFHSWLPDTMEAPTPVSALMHAGIINAGGFLVIRLSPLIALSHSALGLLALVGAFTALFGGLVMLTQTSIKRALAFSTIAQMGFMMLQCGLGAFSAALLHIVAHSLYKAHAFLACGSVLDGAARLKTEARPALEGVAAIAALPVAIGIAAGLCAAPVVLCGIDVAAKPGAVVLGLVMAVALTTLVWQALLSGSWKLAAGGIAGGLVVSLAYVGAYLGVDEILQRSAVAHAVLPTSVFDIAVSGLVVVGFLGVFAIQAATASLSRLPAIRALHVHAANGFYCDIPARRITARVWGLTTPVP